jgi:hypothetical protein
VNIPGKPTVFVPHVGAGYRHSCSRIAADGYTGFRFEGAAAANSEFPPCARGEVARQSATEGS